MSCDWFSNKLYKKGLAMFFKSPIPLWKAKATRWLLLIKWPRYSPSQLRSAINQKKSLYLTAIWRVHWLNAELEQQWPERWWPWKPDDEFIEEIKATRFRIKIHSRNSHSPSLHMTSSPLEISCERWKLKKKKAGDLKHWNQKEIVELKCTGKG